MKKFRNSEIFFLTLGTVLVAIALIFLHFDISVAKFLNLNLEHGDPFQASYTAPALPAATPPPTVTAPTPHPVLDPPEASIFLTYPANQAVMTKMGNPQKGYPIKFKFEVYPRFTPCSIELIFKDKTVITKEINGSGTGTYAISVLIKKPGLYQWRIKTSEISSELRTVTIHD